MANYTASALLAAQAKFIPKFNEPEIRRKQNPALMLAMKNLNVCIPGHQELRKKDTRPVKAYTLKARAASGSVAKAHNHSGTKADSAETTLAWVQFVEPFKVIRKAGQSNMFDYAAQLQHELTESAKNIHSRAGTAALAYLQSNRTQLAAPSTGGAGTWDAANFALLVDANEKNNFFQNASSFMRKQNYRGMFDVLADSKQYRLSQYIANQGGGNATNLGWQLSDMNILETTEDIDENFTDGCALIMPEGYFAGMPWNDPLNLKGKGDFDSYLGGYGVIQDPLGSGLLLDFHAYTDRLDGSAVGGSVQDEVLEGEVTLTIGWALPPISTASESVVYEIAQGS